MHHETLTRKAMKKQKLSSEEIAKVAGFASAKDLGEGSAAMLNRFVEAGKLRCMEIGNRIFYQADVARTLLNERRSEVPEGWVSATAHGVTRGYSRRAGPFACRTGKIKNTKQIIVPGVGRRATWFCDKAELDAWFDRERVAYGAAAKSSKVPPVNKPKVEQPKADVSTTVARLEKVAAALTQVAERLEKVLGSTEPVKDKPAIEMKIPAFTNHIR